MGVEVDRRGSELAPGQFEDHEGYVGPVPSGFGARSSPLGQFPTGPEVGSRLPDVVALSTAGHTINIQADREGHPAVLVFTRSAVW